MNLILGSSSPNRRDLLNKMGIAYTLCEPEYEEVIDASRHAVDQVQEFALGKAESVYKKIQRQELGADFLVISFDSLIWCNGRSVGKAKNKEEALQQLQSFVGKPQDIITGVALLGQMDGKKVERVFYETTSVQFRTDVTEKAIRSFLEFGDWEGKCGSYSILGTGIFFLESVEGDFQNIIGIPVLKMGEAIEDITGKNIFEVLEVRRDVS